MEYPDDDPIPEETLTWDKVLGRFGLPMAVPPEQLDARRRWAGKRICNKCGDEKIISEERCDFPYMSRGKGSFRHTCTDCRREYEMDRRRRRPGPRKPYEADMRAAPRVAAMQLLEEYPEALGLLIKYFRKEFEPLYLKEKARVIQKEQDRLKRYQTRPQAFRSDVV